MYHAKNRLRTIFMLAFSINTAHQILQAPPAGNEVWDTGNMPAQSSVSFWDRLTNLFKSNQPNKTERDEIKQEITNFFIGIPQKLTPEQKTKYTNQLRLLSRTERQNLFTDITNKQIEAIQASRIHKLTNNQIQNIFINNTPIYQLLLPRNEIIIPIEKRLESIENIFQEIIPSDTARNTDTFAYEIIDFTPVEKDLEKINPEYLDQIDLTSLAELLKEELTLKIPVIDINRHLKNYVRFALASELKKEKGEQSQIPLKKNHADVVVQTIRLLKEFIFDITSKLNSSEQHTKESLWKEISKKTNTTIIKNLLISLSSQQHHTIFNVATNSVIGQLNINRIENRRALLSLEEVRNIYIDNAKIYQFLVPETEIIIPIERESKKEQDSFQFEIIDVSSCLPNLEILAKEESRQNLEDLKNGTITNNKAYLTFVSWADRLKNSQKLKLSLQVIYENLIQFTINLQDRIKIKEEITTTPPPLVDDTSESETEEEPEKISRPIIKPSLFEEVLESANGTQTPRTLTPIESISMEPTPRALTPRIKDFSHLPPLTNEEKKELTKKIINRLELGKNLLYDFEQLHFSSTGYDNSEDMKKSYEYKKFRDTIEKKHLELTEDFKNYIRTQILNYKHYSLKEKQLLATDKNALEAIVNALWESEKKSAKLRKQPEDETIQFYHSTY